MSVPVGPVLPDNFLPWQNFKEFFFLDKETFENVSGKCSFQVLCQLCAPKRKLFSASSSSSSNLRKHLKVAHPSAMKRLYKISPGRRKRESEAETSSSFKQIKINDLQENGRLTNKISQEKVNSLIEDVFIENLLSYNAVESDSFIKLVHSLHPGCEVLGQKALSSRIIQRAQTFKNELRTILQDVKFVATTADCWKSAKGSYIGMTVHWVDQNNLERQMSPLACRRIIGHHTYDVLAKAIDSIHRDFAIQNKVTMTTTDNGSNFLKAFKEYSFEENEDDDDSDLQFVNLDEIFSQDLEETKKEFVKLPHHQRCAAHTLNLVVVTDARDAESNDIYKRQWKSVSSKLHVLWNMQSHSSITADIIKQELGRYLTVPNVTSWNSTYEAINCVKSFLHDGTLDRICDLIGLTCLEQKDKQFIEEYCLVMKSVARALDELQGEKNAYMAILLPTICTLQRKLEAIDSLKYCKPLLLALQVGIRKRFANMLENEKFILAAALHPRFQFSWLKNGEKENSTKMLLRDSLECIENCSREQETASQEEENFFDFVVTPKTEITLFDQFLLLGGKDLKILDEHPAIKELFIKYNTPVPSSASVERLFSRGGAIFSSRRERLNDEDLESLILLNPKNKNIF